MNPGRTDCPDIDIDFCWRRRDEIIRYCYEHWGFERVAMVCNVNRYRLRSAIRDVGGHWAWSRSRSISWPARARSSGLPPSIGWRRTGGYPAAPGCPLRRDCGHARPRVRNRSLERANKGVIITQYDKDAAEAIGLVKIDLLGNRSLSTVNEAIQILRAGEWQRESDFRPGRPENRGDAERGATVSACFKASRPACGNCCAG